MVHLPVAELRGGGGHGGACQALRQRSIAAALPAAPRLHLHLRSVYATG